MKPKFEQYADLLNSHEVRSKIIQDVSFIDLFLGIVISTYLTTEDRDLAFYMTTISQMEFSRKIETLCEIVKDKPYRSAEIVQRLERIRRLKNAVSHTHDINTDEKIFSDQDIIHILSDYPESYEQEIATIKTQLRRLGNTTTQTIGGDALN